MKIRKAAPEDLEFLPAIYERAREFMVRTGNPDQWVNGYPSVDDLLADLKNNALYVCETPAGKIAGAFCFMAGPDPTYRRIENGRWLNDAPYHVLHRLSSDGSCHGIARACLEWCQEKDRNLRVDTHADNRVMQHILETHGFHKCGTVYTHNGTPRIAYQTDFKITSD